MCKAITGLAFRNNRADLLRMCIYQRVKLELVMHIIIVPLQPELA